MKLNALTSVHKLNLIATCYLQKYLTNRFLLLNQIANEDLSSDSIGYRVPSNTHNLKGETLSPKHYVYSQQ